MARPIGVKGDLNKVFSAFKIGNVQKISFSGTNATAVATTSTLIEIVSLDVACHISIDATATTSSKPIPPGAALYYRIVPGDIINVISAGVDGSLFITEMI